MRFSKKDFLAVLEANLKDCPDVEVDVLKEMDELGQWYFYVHLKDYSDGTQWKSATTSVLLVLNSFNCVRIICSSIKRLWWIPIDQTVEELRECGVQYKVQKRTQNKQYRSVLSMVRDTMGRGKIYQDLAKRIRSKRIRSKKGE